MEKELVNLYKVAWKFALSGADKSKCFNALTRLRYFPITIGLLTNIPNHSDILKDIKFLQEHPNNKIKDLSSLVVSTWRKKLQKQFVEYDKSCAEIINKYNLEGKPLKIILKVPKPKINNDVRNRTLKEVKNDPGTVKALKVENRTVKEAKNDPGTVKALKVENMAVKEVKKNENANPGTVKALKVQKKSFKKVSHIQKPKILTPEEQIDMAKKIQKPKTHIVQNRTLKEAKNDPGTVKAVKVVNRTVNEDKNGVNANPGTVKALKVQTKSFKKASHIQKPKILIPEGKIDMANKIKTSKAGDGQPKKSSELNVERKCMSTRQMSKSDGDSENICATSQLMTPTTDANSEQGWKAPINDVQLSPTKVVRAAMLKRRFADTILKAQHDKALVNYGKADPQEKERLRKRQVEEKARMEAEIRDAEAALRKRERAAARIALEEMERTAEIENNQEIIQELEKLCGCSLSYSNRKGAQSRCSLERLGLFLKDDIVDDEILDELEEGEISP